MQYKKMQTAAMLVTVAIYKQVRQFKAHRLDYYTIDY